LWRCALSFAEQFRSLIAGQDPLRVLKEVCFCWFFLIGFILAHCPQTFPDAQKANTLVFCCLLYQTDWDFHCEARYRQGQVSITQRRDYCCQLCAEVTRLIPKERRQELLKSDIEFLRFLLTWPAAKLFRRWPDEWNRANIEQLLAR
jgi:hypothetical protein